MSESSLKSKTIRGVGWSAIDNISRYIVSFVIGIVLARLLSPDDYGLLGLIAIFTSISATIINGGFWSALIRKIAPSDYDYNTVFLVNIVASVILYLILYAAAGWIASFFGRHELVNLVRVSSLTIVIGSLSFVHAVQLNKKIDFKSQTKISLISSIAGGILGILMAIFDCGVWSLVAQSLLSGIISTALFWYYIRWIPKFRFSSKSFTELFGYSWKMLTSELLDTVWKELYQVVVGRFYSPATLGQYSRSKSFAQLFSSNLTSVVQKVTFPVLSEMQEDKNRMKNAYRRIIKTTMLPTAVCMFALGAVAEPLVYCLIGDQWHEAAIYLPFICVSMSFYPLHSINLNVLKISGRSDLFLILEIIKKFVLLIPLLVGIYVGIIPMLIVNIISTIICFFLNSHWSGKFINYSSWSQLKDITPFYVIATVVALSVYFLKFLPISNWVILPIQFIVGTFIFFTICELTKLDEYAELKEIIQPYIKKSNGIKYD